jgi:hypothetical protein
MQRPGGVPCHQRERPLPREHLLSIFLSRAPHIHSDCGLQLGKKCKAQGTIYISKFMMVSDSFIPQRDIHALEKFS